MTHRIISTNAQSLATYSIWFTGTKEDCEHQLPRIKRWAAKLSDDEFQIIDIPKPSKECDECGYVDDAVASHYEECSKLDPQPKKLKT